jgi:hypothetical protein
MTSQFIALCIEAGIPVSTEAELAMMVTRGLGFILTIDDISGYPNIVVGRVSNITFESSDESSGAWLNLRTDVTTDLCRMQTRSCSISYSGQGPEEMQFAPVF